jgi:hypothetical protein
MPKLPNFLGQKNTQHAILLSNIVMGNRLIQHATHYGLWDIQEEKKPKPRSLATNI